MFFLRGPGVLNWRVWRVVFWQLIVTTWVGFLCHAHLWAAAPQRGRGDPATMFDPEKFLEQFFGQETPEQKKKLAQIEVAPEEERRFGQQAREAFVAELRRQRIDIITRGPEVAYLQSLVAELKPLMHNGRRYRTITVWLADTPDADARCFPGGTLIVFRGMLAAAQSEAALVAVLGHELSHIDHGHQLRYLKSMKLAQQTFTAPQRGFDFERMMSNTMFLARSFARPFRPEEEAEADEDGVNWAYQLGYDPREFAKLFLRWEKKQGDRQQNLPSFLRSHPYHRDRYEAVIAQYKRLMRVQPRDDLYIGAKNLIQLVPRSKRRFRE